MDIVVLCGGLSTERDVSITSGSKVAAALRELGHRAVLVDVYFGYTGAYDDPKEIFSLPDCGPKQAIGEQTPDLETVRKSRVQDNDSLIGDNVFEICRAADIVFLGLHGSIGEDGRLQAALDLQGIRYTGCGYLASAMAMNKQVAKEMFVQNGIRAPEGFVQNVNDKRRQPAVYPCVVKPRSGGSSVGTSIAHDEKEYGDALDLAFKYEDNVLVETYIKGREVDVGVLEGKALPAIEICPRQGFYDYKNKYQSGMTDEYCPADFPPEITEKLQKAAVDVYNALGMEVYARMDFIVDGAGEVWCLEANTLPGMTPMSLMPQEAAAAGISYKDLCQRIIDGSMRKYQ